MFRLLKFFYIQTSGVQHFKNNLRAVVVVYNLTNFFLESTIVDEFLF